MARIAIIGLGLIGGSLGLALKAAPREDLAIWGYDEDGRARERARLIGAVDWAVESPRAAVADAGLVVVATPAARIAGVFEAIAPALAPDAVVTDVASTKGRILEWAAQHLPQHVSFVGGHPLAGKTEAGVEHAEAGLFQGRPYAVVPSERAGETAVRSVIGLIHAVGAQERFMTADEHDHFVAAVSHLPLAASTALFTLLRRSQSWADFGKIAGPAYHDLTRLASGDPDLAADIASMNREEIQYWLDRYILELKRFRDLLDGPNEEILAEFANAQSDRARFLAGEDLEDQPRRGAAPDSPPSMAALLLGPKIYARLRGVTKRAAPGVREARERP